MSKPDSKRYSHNRPLLRVIRIIITIIPFAYVYFSINLGDLQEILPAVAWWTVPVLLTSTIASIFLQGLRWWVLLRQKVPKLPLSRAMNVHLRSNYYSLILPTSAAQDIVRASLISKESDYRAAWAASWIARLLGLGVLSLYSLTGLFLLKNTGIPRWTIHTVYIASGSILALSILSFTKTISRLFRPVFRRILPLKTLEIFEGIREAVFTYRDHKKGMILALVTTGIVHMLMMSTAAFVIYGISGRFLWIECIAFMSVVEIVCITVPITPNGIGVRETLLIGFFEFFNLSDETLALYVTLGVLSVGAKLIGGIPILFESKGRFPKKRE